MEDIAKFAGETVGVLDTTLKDVRIPRANLGPCPVCGNDIVENRKGYSCWSREDPGCGFVIWKCKAGKQLPARGRARADRARLHGAAGHRLQGPLGPLVPGQARARAERDEERAGASSSTSRGPRRAPSRPRRPRRPARRWRRGPMRARRPRRTLFAGAWLALASALALLGPAIAAADKAGSVTASGGAVQATLSWQAADFGVKDPRLIIARAGAPLFDGSPLADAEVCSVGCIYAPSKDDTPLQVADLGGDGEPEVVVDSYTGGAHCCIVSDVLYFTGAAYARAEHNWGSYGYALKDLNGDGRPELDGYDAAFEDAFTSHAASFEPPLGARLRPHRRGLPARRHARLPGGHPQERQGSAAHRGRHAAPPRRDARRRGELRGRPVPAGARARGAAVPRAGAQARRPAHGVRARRRAASSASCWPSCTSRATASRWPRRPRCAAPRRRRRRRRRGAAGARGASRPRR